MANQVEINPSLSVVPIVGLNPDGSCGAFLGTGTFVGENNMLVTCDHVLAQWDGGYGISAQEEPPKLYSAEPIYRNTDTDLACLRVEEYVPPYSFPLEDDEEISLNELVCSFEYGTTDVVAGHIVFSPANRVGNVTRTLNWTDRFGAAGDKMLELSYAALKGASGAPVIATNPPFYLKGILSQNVSRELHPSQVEKIEDDEGNVVEETKFYLPQGLAIHFMHVRDMLDSLEE